MLLSKEASWALLIVLLSTWKVYGEKKTVIGRENGRNYSSPNSEDDDTYDEYGEDDDSKYSCEMEDFRLKRSSLESLFKGPWEQVNLGDLSPRKRSENGQKTSDPSLMHINIKMDGQASPQLKDRLKVSLTLPNLSDTKVMDLKPTPVISFPELRVGDLGSNKTDNGRIRNIIPVMNPSAVSEILTIVQTKMLVPPNEGVGNLTVDGTNDSKAIEIVQESMKTLDKELAKVHLLNENPKNRTTFRIWKREAPIPRQTYVDASESGILSLAEDRTRSDSKASSIKKKAVLYHNLLNIVKEQLQRGDYEHADFTSLAVPQKRNVKSVTDISWEPKNETLPQVVFPLQSPMKHYCRLKRESSIRKGTDVEQRYPQHGGHDEFSTDREKWRKENQRDEEDSPMMRMGSTDGGSHRQKSTGIKGMTEDADADYDDSDAQSDDESSEDESADYPTVKAESRGRDYRGPGSMSKINPSNKPGKGDKLQNSKITNYKAESDVSDADDDDGESDDNYEGFKKDEEEVNEALTHLEDMIKKGSDSINKDDDDEPVTSKVLHFSSKKKHRNEDPSEDDDDEFSSSGLKPSKDDDDSIFEGRKARTTESPRVGGKRNKQGKGKKKLRGSSLPPDFDEEEAPEMRKCIVPMKAQKARFKSEQESNRENGKLETKERLKKFEHVVPHTTRSNAAANKAGMKTGMIAGVAHSRSSKGNRVQVKSHFGERMSIKDKSFLTDNTPLPKEKSHP